MRAIEHDERYRAHIACLKAKAIARMEGEMRKATLGVRQQYRSTQCDQASTEEDIHTKQLFFTVQGKIVQELQP
jgi:hypothetical protein